MDIVTTSQDLRRRLRDTGTVALVPTMGNLHEGHISLVRIAREHADTVVATIFVNRLQFAPNEDFDRYPRTFEPDKAALQAAGVDVLFAPDEAEVYPVPQTYRVTPGPLAEELEGKSRPGFFHGVCTVVLKLFNLVPPDVAVFGKKDRQQLAIVRGMVEQFNLPIRIVAGETVRAADGLALSSRNGYLSPAQRAEAPNLHRVLRAVADAIARGQNDYAQLDADARHQLTERGWRVDYIATRQGQDLRVPAGDSVASRDIVVLGAATLGTTRLIDNVDVERPAG